MSDGQYGAVAEVTNQLLATAGVAAAINGRQATPEWIVSRVVDAAVAVVDRHPRASFARDVIVAAISGHTNRLCMAGSQVNVHDLVTGGEQLARLAESELSKRARSAVKQATKSADVDGDGEPQEPEPPAADATEGGDASVDTPTEDAPTDAAPKVDAGSEESQVVVVRKTSVTQLDINGRARNAYVRAGLNTVGDLLDYDTAKTLQAVDGVGDDFVSETMDAIKKLAVSKGVEFSDLR